MTIAALAVACIGASSGAAAALRAVPPAGGRPGLDVRGGERTPVPGDVRSARHALAERLGIEAHVATDPVGGGIRVLNRTDGFLSGRHAGDPADVALAWVRDHAGVFGLTDAQIAALRPTARSTSNDGVTHLTWAPYRDGIPAYDGELRVDVTRDGRVVSASGPPLGGLAPDATAPRLSAGEALAAAQADVGARTSIPRATQHAGAQRVTTFANGDRASLVVFPSPAGDRLAWRLTVAGGDPYVYDEVVDAANGDVLARHSLTDFAVAHADVYPYRAPQPAGPRSRSTSVRG